MDNPVFIQLLDINKSLGGIKALKNVSLQLKKGKVHCLLGENGSGKSTLVKVLAGVHKADSGEIFIDGKVQKEWNPLNAIHKGIDVIYQDFSLFPNLTVAENIALCAEIANKNVIVDHSRMQRIATESMQKLHISIPPAKLVEELSVANKQLVAIARALRSDAKLIIMDEPTTSLTAKEINLLFEIIQKLKSSGISILLVNHKIDEVKRIGESLTILRNGKNVISGKVASFSKEDIVMHMSGREIKNTYFRSFRSSKTEDELFRVEKLCCRGVCKDVSFSLCRGEIFGITGLLGSGTGEIGEILFGIRKVSAGNMLLNGETIIFDNPKQAVKYGIALVPEDRLTQGLFLDQSIVDNLIISSLKLFQRRGVLCRKIIQDRVLYWTKKFNIATYNFAKSVRSLSGGNQQKVVLAKWLNNNPKLLIMNGPTVGVDVGTKSDIYQLLQDLAKNGIGVIIISSDLPELLSNCARILIMKSGRVSKIFNSHELDEDRLSELLILDSDNNTG